jgi:hypothetical protein
MVVYGSDRTTGGRHRVQRRGEAVAAESVDMLTFLDYLDYDFDRAATSEFVSVSAFPCLSFFLESKLKPCVGSASNSTAWNRYGPPAVGLSP